ncbi:hypothetical protein [Pelagicoccus sp. SDUM812003]|uniref:hypothetical protein n=1 Tax=Pelagicoccus sp. SDUM812003 TaxID=3041267 RepID=UPI002811740A|nr:hypothetical protein [Pelagicoccus sp. SDUM812003]
MTKEHVKALDRAGIRIALTLTNHFFRKEDYELTLPILEKHHCTGNSIICVNDSLARQIKNDFPKYSLKASVIKKIDSQRRLESAFDLYDQVVLPMDRNDDLDFLSNLPEKRRVILFANGGCAYNCPSRTCYYGVSQKNQGKAVTRGCSREVLNRKSLGFVYFDVEAFLEMGFREFKLVPRIASSADSALYRWLSQMNLGYGSV